MPQPTNKTPINANYSVLANKERKCNPPKKYNAEKLITAIAGGFVA